MRILLLGRSGQVGWELQRALRPLGDLVTPGRDDRSGLCGDLSRPQAVQETVRAVAPQVIVNAAAYTRVDQAESEPELARLVNAEAVGALAAVAREAGVLLVHYSTDYVFDGSGTRAWQEGDVTRPLNVYGATKLAGEQAIRDAGASHLIFRTSWVYAARGRNFIATMLRLASERETLTVIDDQVGAPTGADLIADVTAHAIRATLTDPGLAGLYHLAPSGETSWYGYARHVLRRARQAGAPVRVPEAAIEPVATEAFPVQAPRPRNSRLDTRRLCRAFGLMMPPWQAGVEHTLDEILERGS